MGFNAWQKGLRGPSDGPHPRFMVRAQQGHYAVVDRTQKARPDLNRTPGPDGLYEHEFALAVSWHRHIAEALAEAGRRNQPAPSHAERTASPFGTPTAISNRPATPAPPSGTATTTATPTTKSSAQSTGA